MHNVSNPDTTSFWRKYNTSVLAILSSDQTFQKTAAVPEDSLVAGTAVENETSVGLVFTLGNQACNNLPRFHRLSTSTTTTAILPFYPARQEKEEETKNLDT